MSFNQSKINKLEGNKIAKIFAAELLDCVKQSQNSVSLHSCYLACQKVLKECVDGGYTSTLICPSMMGQPTEWAQFQAVLVNEIVRFTNIAPRPACLVSGGSLNLQPNRNLEFIFSFFEALHSDIVLTKSPIKIFCFNFFKKAQSAQIEIELLEFGVEDFLFEFQNVSKFANTKEAMELLVQKVFSNISSRIQKSHLDINDFSSLSEAFRESEFNFDLRLLEIS